MNDRRSTADLPIDRPATDEEREQMRVVMARGRQDEQEERKTPPGSTEEAEAINAISKAMGQLDERARLRVAEWARSVAEVEPRDTFRRLQFVMIAEMYRIEDAINAHRNANTAPTRQDVAMYAAALGTERLTRRELALYYSDDEPETTEVVDTETPADA